MRAALILFLLSAILPAADNPDPSTLLNKVLLGYQGWFTCPADGSNRWTHWSRGVPTPDTLTVDLFPDVSELDADERCEIPSMTINGQPAYVFSSRNPKTVLRHFQWMKQYGLDGVLVQRFVGEIPRKHQDGDVVLHNIMRAAAQTGRTFAIEYDISGANPQTFAQTIEEDWRYLVDQLHITSQPGYQHHNGKPLLSVWGMGLNDGNNHPPDDPAAALAIIRWFKSDAPEKYRVTYMGGVPAHWSSLTADSRTDPAWAKVYAAMDVVQPWNVGRYGTLAAVDKWKTDVIAADVKTAADHQLYMPVAFPGFSWHNLKHTAKENQIPRLAGDFLWRQAYDAKTAGVTMLKIAMFDEVDEGTAILKAAAHRNQAPSQGYWLTLDADGDNLPSDWYLRLAGQITKMFHGEIQATAKPPIKPAN
ncbi:MAG TPA: glycoside hydrolase family 71/99-like protein [Bryobacteraceae bacterium]|nr:glycoside hydrolase family 71/99-like protein [Bryobacteraceae bacterium]